MELAAATGRGRKFIVSSYLYTGFGKAVVRILDQLYKQLFVVIYKAAKIPHVYISEAKNHSMQCHKLLISSHIYAHFFNTS